MALKEFFTLVWQIEAVINSGPLCLLANDPNDLSVVTPAHFLVGSSFVVLPDLDYLEIPMNRLNIWKLVQNITQSLWKRWSNKYFNKLQQRPKWSERLVKFMEGFIILVKNADNARYLKWYLARIIKTYQGKDNILIVVTIKDKIYIRYCVLVFKNNMLFRYLHICIVCEFLMFIANIASI